MFQKNVDLEMRDFKKHFIPIMNFLIEHEQERDLFLEHPESYIQQTGVLLSNEEASILKKISLYNIRKKNKFNEKLVLCSSSGY